MSGKLLHLKDKISVTKKTKKITKAMELVASSKVRHFQKKAENLEKFSHSFSDLVKNIGIDVKRDEDSENNYNPLFILYTSDKGLCGGMNTKLIESLTDSNEYKKSNHKNIIVIGKKGIDFATSRKLNIQKSLINLNERPDEMEILDIVDSILEIWNKNIFTDLLMVVPRFASSFTFYPNVKKIFPIESSTSEIETDFIDNIEFEPSFEDVNQNAMDIFIYSLIYSGFYSLKAAEYLSRMIAMQNATKSAEDIIKAVTIEYNSVRQSVITQEIIEVINGS